MVELIEHGSLTRIWLQELAPVPPLRGPQLEAEITVATTSTEAGCILRAGVERFSPLGPMQYYGLLGGTFELEASRSGLRIVVVAQPAGDLWPDAIAPPYLPVHVGLSHAHARATLEVLEREAFVLGNGTLTINVGCGNEVASAPIIFQVLAMRLVEALRVSGEPERLSLFRRSFKL